MYIKLAIWVIFFLVVFAVGRHTVRHFFPEYSWIFMGVASAIFCYGFFKIKGGNQKN